MIYSVWQISVIRGTPFVLVHSNDALRTSAHPISASYRVNNGDGHNINFGSSMELAFEVQKLQLTNAHKDKTITHLKQDIARLTEMLELHKQVKA